MEIETKRQFIHAALFLPVFLLNFLGKTGLVVLFVGLFLFAVLFIPRSKLRNVFYRQAENKYSFGAVSYFVIVVVLILFFPTPAAIAAWAALSLGDGFSTIIGLKYGGKKLPWNKKCSYAGSAAFVLATFVGCLVALWFLVFSLTLGQIILISLIAAIVGGLVESLPIKLNDNVSVPLVVAALVTFLFKIL